MKQRSYAQLQVRYGGQFIAQRNSKVLASGKTLRALFQQLAKKKIAYDASVLISHVHPKDAVCIYAHCLSAS